MKKIFGVGIWIWAFGALVIALITMVAIKTAGNSASAQPLKLEIVKRELWKIRGTYQVKGQIHNPKKEPSRGVALTFKISEYRLIGNKMSKKPLGEADAVIDYIPAGATVDFTAMSNIATMAYDNIDIDEGAIREK